MIKITSKGDFHTTSDWIQRLLHHDVYSELDRFGQMGVDALMSATPVGETGRAAASWHYRIVRSGKKISVEWYNTDVIRGDTPVVILLQYGHATGTGGYVRGRDFINPAMKPVFDEIANEIWKKVMA